MINQEQDDDGTEVDQEPETSVPEDAVAEAVDGDVMEAAPKPHDLNDDFSGSLSPGPQADQKRSSAFMGVPIEVIISVGKARPLVSELVKLRRDSVISLDSRIDDPVEIYVGDRLIARGELQEMEDEEGRLGVRLTEVADLSNGV